MFLETSSRRRIGIATALVAFAGMFGRMEAADTWSLTGSMNSPRFGHTSTGLSDGRVLVTGRGGFVAADLTASAEIYDPVLGAWSLTEPMSTARSQQTATLLPDGRVVVIGGFTGNGTALASAEVYDPATGKWSMTGSMSDARYSHTATLLLDGRVLVTGGPVVGDGNSSTSAEIYDPATGTWSRVHSMIAPRSFHTATLLFDGTVLVTGGLTLPDLLASAEIYDPVGDIWSLTGPMSTSRVGSTATRLLDGRVLVTGGASSSNTADVYDPVTGTWSVTGAMSVGADGPAALLPDGRVLLAGGSVIIPLGNGFRITPVNSAEIYDPVTNGWSRTESMIAARDKHTATTLFTGQVLITGGCCVDPTGGNGDDPLSSAEIFSTAVAPPTIVSLIATPNVLWPPNHKMVPVSVGISAADATGVAPLCQVTAVSSTEPVSAHGDTDWVITGARTVWLRAERAGAGPGRVYTISVSCTNAAGLTATKDVTVQVPHDQRSK